MGRTTPYAAAAFGHYMAVAQEHEAVQRVDVVIGRVDERGNGGRPIRNPRSKSVEKGAGGWISGRVSRF